VGGWPEYVRVRDERRAGVTGTSSARLAAPTAASSPASTSNGNGSAPSAGRKAPSKARAKPKGPSKNRLSEAQKAERSVEDAEAALRDLEAELADPAAWATRYESAKSEARHTAARRAVDEAYAHLEELVD
jgi:ATP-binding cassette subfamily F protein 3